MSVVTAKNLNSWKPGVKISSTHVVEEFTNIYEAFAGNLDDSNIASISINKVRALQDALNGLDAEIDGIAASVAASNAPIAKIAIPTPSGFASSSAVYWKDRDNVLHINGSVQIDAVGGTTRELLTLPTGYRPSAIRTQFVTGLDFTDSQNIRTFKATIGIDGVVTLSPARVGQVFVSDQIHLDLNVVL